MIIINIVEVNTWNINVSLKRGLLVRCRTLVCCEILSSGSKKSLTNESLGSLLLDLGFSPFT